MYCDTSQTNTFNMLSGMQTKNTQTVLDGLNNKSKSLPTSQLRSNICCNLDKDEDNNSKSSAYAHAPKYELFTKQPK